MDLDDRIAGVASLNEPVRRDLYRFVVAQDGPVSRDAAGEGVGVARHTAKFHLDRLVEDGLLAVDYQRLTNRRGPGAGRPTKLYRRADREVTVSLPERHYELVADLLATAVEASARARTPVSDALHDAASARGRQLAEAGAPEATSGRASATAVPVLESHGYEPRQHDGRVELVNCPFHQLAQDHTELVCGLNLALLAAFVEQLPGDGLTARLDPAPGRCCVVLEPPPVL